VQKILAGEGTVVIPGTVLALFEETVEILPATSPTTNGATATIPESRQPGETKPTSRQPRPFVVASPAARRLAKYLQIDLAEIAQRLSGGVRLNEAVVRRFAAQMPVSDPWPEAGDETHAIPARRQPQSSLRRLIRHRVSRAVQLSAAVTLTSEADVTNLLEWLEQRNQLRPTGEQPLTMLAALLRATALSLIEHPLLNANLQGDEVLYLLERNIGLVLAVPDGVVVPVVREVDKLSLTQLAATVHQLEEAAGQGSLRLKDTVGSTFTVSDMGAYGIDSFTPILNLEQTGMLGLGRVYMKPIWSTSGANPTNFEIRQFVTLNLTFDHRVADGPTAGTCLQKIIEYLQHPERIYD
jgi:pyruvate dehydrogenase E2 component (dihydrolipoamide acetyltransferase)